MLSSIALVQKSAGRRAQSAFWCRACGGEGKLIVGLCSRCYARRYWDKHYFAGLHAQVLERDGYACQLCARPAQGKRSIFVHYRRPGVSKVPSLISLCPACHAWLQRTQVWALHAADFGNGSFAVLLWRELHLGAPEQLALEFESPAWRPRSAREPSRTCELPLG